MEHLASSSELAARIDYHLRASIVLTAAGRPAEAASEGIVALSLFRLEHGDVGRGVEDLPSAGSLDPAQRREVAGRAGALSRQLQAHYTSEGQHEVARLYEQVATATDSPDWL